MRTVTVAHDHATTRWLDREAIIRLLSFRLAPRDRHERHRAATPLELMFDLASVIAVAAAAAGLHHAVAEAHLAEGLIGFLASFFMIWWAWMNYTWFASAYDDGSLGFRVLSTVIMFGALMLAAGIPAVFAHQRIWLAVFGFIVMRLGMVAFWLAAASGDPARRRTALAYAGGVAAMQLYWIGFVALVAPTAAIYLPLFALGAVGELAVPALAERHGDTTWHRHHIIERYGLMNIIVLGECFIAIVAMIQLESGAAMPEWPLLWLAILAGVITFSMWGLYFTDEEHLGSDELPRALLWGYGHFALFAAGAATGAGFHVMLEVATHHTHVEARTAALSVAVPVALYMATLWLIRDRFCLAGPGRWLLLVGACTVAAVGAWAPAPMPLVAVGVLATVLLRRTLPRMRAPESETP